MQGKREAEPVISQPPVRTAFCPTIHYRPNQIPRVEVLCINYNLIHLLCQYAGWEFRPCATFDLSQQGTSVAIGWYVLNAANLLLNFTAERDILCLKGVDRDAEH